jgi:hypothetical protein
MTDMHFLEHKFLDKPTPSSVTLTLVLLKFGIALQQNEHGQLVVSSESQFISGIQHFIVIVFSQNDNSWFYLDPTYSQFSVQADEISPIVYVDSNDIRI